MTALKIAAGLSLPVDVAGEAIAILAKRGAGKTNTATVLVEELAAANVQTVVLDPVGAWWGLRSSADGKGEGLPFPILGGARGDVPLEPTAGKLIADVVVDTGQSLVLDLSDFPSKTQVARFVTDFADHLYRRKARARSLVHLVLEEADEFAPQRPFREETRMLGAIEQIVRRGRGRGVGMTMVTQRSAALNKNVLEQADVLIVLRTTGPNDRKAIEAWISKHAADGAEDVLPSLPGLDTGEAWVWNPERDVLKRVQIRRRRTFDSSSTPKAGEKRAEPQTVAPINLEHLGAQIAATVEKAKDNDPAELRLRTAKAEKAQEILEAQIRKLQTLLQERPPETVVERVEVAVLNGNLDRLVDAVHGMVGLAEGLQGAAELVLAGSREISTAIASVTAARAETAERREEVRPVRPVPARPPARPPSPPAAQPDADGGTAVKLGKGERTVLEVLAEWPDGRTHNELAFLAGYSAKASTLGVILATLRRAGLVEAGQPIRATADGLAAAGGVRERPTGQALLDEWLRHPRMGEGERRVLLALVDAYPEALSHDDLCDRTGYSPAASTMGVILSKLRKLGLVEKGARRVATEFAEAIRA